MKDLLLGLFSIIVTSLLMSSCTESVISPELTDIENSSVLSTIKNRAPGDIIVFPSGDMSGDSDSEAIQDAVNNVTQGGKIILGAGQFVINRTISTPLGFTGRIQGTGKEETVISGSLITPFQNTLLPRPSIPPNTNQYSGSAFFYFLQPVGSVSISDLTMRIHDEFVTEPNDMLWGLPNTSTDLSAFIIVQLGSEECNTNFKNLVLQGTENNHVDAYSWLYHQPYWGIEVMGKSEDFPVLNNGGTHVLRNCKFNKIGVQAMVHQTLKDANIVIKNNDFYDVKQIITRYLDGVDLAITNNRINSFSFGAIVVTQEGYDIPGQLSSVLIKNNQIHTDGFAGIEIGWRGYINLDKPSFKLVIEKNIIVKGDDPTGVNLNLTGIEIANGEESAIVRNNRIRGFSQYGILIDKVDQSLFNKNKFMDFSAAVADYYLFKSDDNIICQSGPTTILDEGIANQLDCPPGN